MRSRHHATSLVFNEGRSLNPIWVQVFLADLHYIFQPLSFTDLAVRMQKRNVIIFYGDRMPVLEICLT